MARAAHRTKAATHHSSTARRATHQTSHARLTIQPAASVVGVGVGMLLLLLLTTTPDRTPHAHAHLFQTWMPHHPRQHHRLTLPHARQASEDSAGQGPHTVQDSRTHATVQARRLRPGQYLRALQCQSINRRGPLPERTPRPSGPRHGPGRPGQRTWTVCELPWQDHIGADPGRMEQKRMRTPGGGPRSAPLLWTGGEAARTRRTQHRPFFALSGLVSLISREF